jgi:hypothetical protein
MIDVRQMNECHEVPRIVNRAPSGLGMRLMIGTSRVKYSVPKTYRDPKIASGIVMVTIVARARGP